VVGLGELNIEKSRCRVPERRRQYKQVKKAVFNDKRVINGQQNTALMSCHYLIMLPKRVCTVFFYYI